MNLIAISRCCKPNYIYLPSRETHLICVGLNTHCALIDHFSLITINEMLPTIKREAMKLFNNVGRSLLSFRIHSTASSKLDTRNTRLSQ